MDEDNTPLLKGQTNVEGWVFGDVVKELSKFDGYNFYADYSSNGIRYLHYYEPPTSSQNFKIQQSDILDYSSFEYTDDNFYNSITVVGEKNVLFHFNDWDSISTYGRRPKRIYDNSITTEEDAESLANTYLQSDIGVRGSITINGNEDIDITEKFRLYIDQIGISSTAEILSYTHKLDKGGYVTTLDFGRHYRDPSNLNTSSFSKLIDGLSEESPGVEGSVIYKSGTGYHGEDDFIYSRTNSRLTLEGTLWLRDSSSYQNVYIGYNAGNSQTTGTNNIALGYSACYENEDGIGNVALGSQSVKLNESGDGNIGIGYYSMLSISPDNCNYNIGLGWKSLYNANGSYNIAIGSGAAASATGSDKLYISKGPTSYPLIYGEFDNHVVKIGDGSAWDGKLYAGDISSSTGLYCTFVSAQSIGGGAGTLTNLAIDTDKDWGAYGIHNLGHLSSQTLSSNSITIGALFMNPTTVEPATNAGTIWMSGTTSECALYMCSANGGSWRPFTIT